MYVPASPRVIPPIRSFQVFVPHPSAAYQAATNEPPVVVAGNEYKAPIRVAVPPAVVAEILYGVAL